ncbi:MAG: hypothetical protein O7G85_16280 [Planctomycetota bacterium]|nr:hypothetical protein [Planctomycetota bacterium]
MTKDRRVSENVDADRLDWWGLIDLSEKQGLEAGYWVIFATFGVGVDRQLLGGACLR